MKVLLCERQFSGHREKYMEWVAKIPGAEVYCFAPENVGVDGEHFIRYDNSMGLRNFRHFRKWVGMISAITKEKDIDIVHILDGDSIMRFFGLGFHTIRNAKLVVTYHHFFEGMLRKISYKMISGGKRAVSVVHTKGVQDAFLRGNIGKAVLCAYPAFDYYRLAGRNVSDAKKYWALPGDVPVIGIVGGLSAYKRIPEFLAAIADCKEAFHLLICGKPGDVTADDIHNCISGYEDKVTLCARKLTEDEYELAIAASDIIYCIYGHSFDGASGPLTDGVCAGKMILSCEHGSLGQIVRTNHLGLTAETDDPAQVLLQTEAALREAKDFRYDETAAGYRESLRPEHFLEKYREIYEQM